MKNLSMLLKSLDRKSNVVDEYESLRLVRPVLKINADTVDGGTNSVFVDNSVLNRTITSVGEPSQTSIAPYGDNWSAYFSGTSDSYVTTNTAIMNFTAAFSVELWFKMEDELTFLGTYANYTSHLITGTVANSFQLSVSCDSGKKPNRLIASSIGNVQSTLIADNCELPYGVWHHVAFVRDSAGNIALYLNGKRVAQGVFTSTYAASAMCVAGNTAGVNSSGMFRGYISDLKIDKLTIAHDPTSTLCAVPTQPHTAGAGTALLMLSKPYVIAGTYASLGLGTRGSPSVEQVGPYGETTVNSAAAYFDGTGDYLHTPSTADLNLDKVSFSIECWVRFTKVGVAQMFFTKLEGDSTWGYSWTMYLTADNRIAGGIYGSVGTRPDWYFNIVQSGANLVVPNRWYHVVMARDVGGAGLHTLFVNGVKQQSTSTGINMLGTSSKVSVGKDLANGSNRTFFGVLAGARVIKGVYAYNPNLNNVVVPTTPPERTNETKLLLNFTNGQIGDSAGFNIIRTHGTARVSTAVNKSSTGSIYFDGVSSYLSVVNKHVLNFSSAEFTIEAWIRCVQRTSSRQYLFEKDGVYQTSASQYSAYLEPTGELSVAIGGAQSEQVINTGYILDLDVWTHITIQRRVNDLEIFANGVKISTVLIDVVLVSGIQPLLIGWSQSVAEVSHFNGYMDNITVYKGRAMRMSNFNPETEVLV